MPAHKLTNSEIDILAVLWRLGPSTVRQIHEELRGVRDSGYTTILKLLQLMVEKGLVVRDDQNRAHVYRATQAPETTRRALVTDLVERAFDGSAHQLALQALGAHKATPEEMAEIRRLLDDWEKEQ
jgi:predicted transcriptional regulator